VPASSNWQGTNPAQIDIGQHIAGFAVCPHAGTWQAADVVGRGERFNQKLVGVQTTAHTGNLGKEWSFLKLNTRQIGVLAIKKAEESNRFIVRLRELHGSDVSNVLCTFGATITNAFETNGEETLSVGAASYTNNILTISNFGHYSPRTFSLTLGQPIPVGVINEKLPPPTAIGVWSLRSDNGIIRMYIPQIGTHDIKIYSLNGHMVDRRTATAHSVIVKLPKGIYIVSVKTNGMSDAIIQRVVNR
jgi:hypothetical protein